MHSIQVSDAMFAHTKKRAKELNLPSRVVIELALAAAYGVQAFSAAAAESLEDPAAEPVQTGLLMRLQRLLEGADEMPADDLCQGPSHSERMRTASAMRSLGWVMVRTRRGLETRRRIWVRPGSDAARRHGVDP